MKERNESNAWLKVENCIKKYGSVTALDSVSFSAGRGVTILHGRNGSGKSTIISILEGLSPTDEGKISVIGYDPMKNPKKVMENVAFLPERPQVFGANIVGDFLYWYGEINHCDYNDIERLLEYFDLRNLIKSKFSNLSSGEKQLIVLSAILSSKKKAYVLDEPNANVDSVRRMQIAMEIEKKARTGASLLVTTHMLDDLLPIADSMIQIKGGSIKKILSRNDIKENTNLTVRIWMSNEQSFQNLADFDITVNKDIVDIRGATVSKILEALTPEQKENIISINSVPEMI